MESVGNPFDLVKATDLSDAQIAKYFVDFPEGASLLARVKPTSPMPMFIYGGKGSGKTHLMRYLSYPLQISRYGRGEDARTGIGKDRYLGIYFRCGGLNASRFSGKGQSDETWRAVFSYYLELWIGRLVLRTICDMFSDRQEILAGPELVSEIVGLLDIAPPGEVLSLADVEAHLAELQRAADIAINNCALTKRLDLQIRASPGRIVFGLPAAIARHSEPFEDLLFLYLVDEFENLTEHQQEYVNTPFENGSRQLRSRLAFACTVSKQLER